MNFWLLTLGVYRKAAVKIWLQRDTDSTEMGHMYLVEASDGWPVAQYDIAIKKTLSHKLEDACTAVQQRIVKALKVSLKPSYSLTLCKSTALQGGRAEGLLVRIDKFLFAASGSTTHGVER